MISKNFLGNNKKSPVAKPILKGPKKTQQNLKRPPNEKDSVKKNSSSTKKDRKPKPILKRKSKFTPTKTSFTKKRQRKEHHVGSKSEKKQNQKPTKK